MPQAFQQTPGTPATPKIDDGGVVLRQIAEGDVAALGQLFDQMARPVYSLAMQLLRNHDDAEDVVESTFWQAWQDSAQLVGTDAQEWLLATGRRRALDQLRLRRRLREELLQDKRQFGALVTTSTQEPGSNETHQTFLRRLQDLAPDERQILELAYFRGLSQSEIADLTGESSKTIKERMRSALQTLREESNEEVQAE